MSKATKKSTKSSSKATKKTTKIVEEKNLTIETMPTEVPVEAEAEDVVEAIQTESVVSPSFEIPVNSDENKISENELNNKPSGSLDAQNQSDRDAILASLKEMNIDISSLSDDELNVLIEEYKEIKSFEVEESEEIEKAIEEVKKESEIDKLALEIEGEFEPKAEKLPNLDEEIEQKIEQELERKKKKKVKEVMTEEKFIEYLNSRRSKIMYFALWELVMKIDDHQSTKQGLYERLKDVTSTDPIDPINEHKFYFGLGYILRLKLYESPVVVFKNGKLKINVNVDNLKKMLEQVGDPISTRPIIPEEKKKKMIEDFFSDSFDEI